MIRKFISIATLIFITLPCIGGLVSKVPVREIKEDLVAEDDEDSGLIPEFTFIVPEGMTVEETTAEESIEEETTAVEETTTETTATDTSLLQEETISNSVSDTESNAVEQGTQDGYQIEKCVMAQIITREIGSGSVAEMAAVAWCIINRVEAGYCGGNLLSVMTSQSQFAYYADGYYKEACYEIAENVIESWLNGDTGYRTLPTGYYWFLGDGKHNYFYSSWDDFHYDAYVNFSGFLAGYRTNAYYPN